MIGVEGTNSGAVNASGTDGFRSAVTDLSTGGTLLVVSDGGDDLHHQCCRRLLGTPTERRLRVLGLTGGTNDVDPWDVSDRLPDGADRDEERLRVVYNDLPARGAVGADAGGSSAGPAGGDPSTDVLSPQDPGVADTRTLLSNASLGQFGVAVETAISELSNGVDDELSEGTLRVCIDDVATLVDIDDAATVAQFVHVLGKRAASQGGLMHAHASLRADSHAVRTLAPFVDGIVYLRNRNGVSEMQWEMQDGPTSEWIPLTWITPTSDNP